MKTRVYVDGFNLYYGALKGTAYKWLNLSKMCKLLLPKNDVVRIYYYTADVKNTPDDLNKEWRQGRYQKALSTLPDVTIVKGIFTQSINRFQKADGTGPVDVVNIKEKRSDVALACQLLSDGLFKQFEVGVLVSGDSDFVPPLKMLKNSGVGVGVLDPQREGTPDSELNKLALFYKPIREGVLKESQFDDTLIDSQGKKFSKPPDWK